MSAYATDMLGPAPLSLMAEKDIRGAATDELAVRAGVGRATHSRSFSSKEGLPAACPVRRWRAYEKEHRLKELAFSNPERALRHSGFCLSLRAEDGLMVEQRRTDAIPAAFETIASDAGLGRDGGYEAAFLAYGLYGMFVTWARSGWKETPQELAALVSGRMLGGAVG
ncbi:regulatory protein, tetR family [Olsenella sp. KH3B4]|uniref:TetR/AcrR family transcriptional regulator n=1 Tax=Olsenella sp. KH3B4 TaxID=1855394 RepID=UPI0008B156AB|nr:TetR/AcrR family transcriptional regulator [Olsenella sp. KH3B4]SET18100.1 regulatory protein, tetR family [Olsenella sp. KH3B4]